MSLRLNSFRLLIFLSLLMLASAVARPALAAAPAVRIYIEPQEGGFESYIAAAIVKKNIPAVVTQNRDEADFILTNLVITHQESTGSKIARCLFVYCEMR